MGGKDSKLDAGSQVQEETPVKVVSKKTMSAQVAASPSKRTQQVEGATCMRADAREFQPDSRTVAMATTLSKPNREHQPFAAKAASDSKDPEWIRFLNKKHDERNALKAPPPAPPAAKPAPIALQTSEYLKLLKASDNKPQPARKVQAKANPNNVGRLESEGKSVEALKSDLTAALDSVIRAHQASVPKSKALPTPARAATSKDAAGQDDALRRIVQMFEATGDKVGRTLKEMPEPAEEASVLTTQDDIAVELTNRDQDLADIAYWSDDERAPRKVNLASAHKLGYRPPMAATAVGDYVMQDMDLDLDHRVAKLLLHVRRLHDRHRSFDKNCTTRRNYVVGLKEVARYVRQGKVKCVIVAPDIEDSTADGAVSDRIRDIMRSAYEQDVPVVYALSRSRIGFALQKALKMSILGILETTGVKALYDDMIDDAYKKRLSWVERRHSAGKKATPPAKPRGEAQAKNGGKGQGKGKK